MADEVFADLYRTYYHRVRRLIKSRLRGASGVDAEDLTQDVFTKVYTYRYHKVLGNPWGLLATMASNAVSDHYRSATHKRLVFSSAILSNIEKDNDFPVMVSTFPEPEDTVQRTLDAKARLLRSPNFWRLSPFRRQLLFMHVAQDMSWEAVWTAAGITRPALYSHVRVIQRQFEHQEE